MAVVEVVGDIGEVVVELVSGMPCIDDDVLIAPDELAPLSPFMPAALDDVLLLVGCAARLEVDTICDVADGAGLPGAFIDDELDAAAEELLETTGAPTGADMFKLA